MRDDPIVPGARDRLRLMRGSFWWIFWAIVAVTVATRVAIAVADYRSLMALEIYQDDAFYYLTIARNIVNGEGMTLDGVHTTNGFQPLFLGLLLPVFAMAGNDLVAPIVASGMILAAFAVGTTFLIFALTRSLAGTRSALFAIALWAVSPYFLFQGMNGQETGIAAFFGVALVLLFVRWIRPGRGLSLRQVVALGVVLGLSILARLDLLLLAVGLAAGWLVQVRRENTLARDLPKALLVAVVGIAVWLPWGLISARATGSWLPTSGVASRQLALSYGWSNLDPVWDEVVSEPFGDPYFDPGSPPSRYFADVATKQVFCFLYEHPLLSPLRLGTHYQTLARNMRDYDLYQQFRRSPRRGSMFALFVLGTVGVLASHWSRRRGRRHKDGRELGVAIAVYLLLVLLGYTFYAPVHWYYARYLTTPVVLTMVYALARVGSWIGPAWDRRRSVRCAATAVGLLLLLCQVNQHRGLLFSRLQWRNAPARGFLASWQALEPDIERPAQVGSFQTGIFSYFSDIDIVNLDGKVNPEASKALAENRLHEYIRNEGIEYIVDWEWLLHSLVFRFMDPREIGVELVRRAGGSNSISLFRMLPASETGVRDHEGRAKVLAECQESWGFSKAWLRSATFIEPDVNLRQESRFLFEWCADHYRRPDRPRAVPQEVLFLVVPGSHWEHELTSSQTVVDRVDAGAMRAYLCKRSAARLLPFEPYCSFDFDDQGATYTWLAPLREGARSPDVGETLFLIGSNLRPPPELHAEILFEVVIERTEAGLTIGCRVHGPYFQGIGRDNDQMEGPHVLVRSRRRGTVRIDFDLDLFVDGGNREALVASRDLANWTPEDVDDVLCGVDSYLDPSHYAKPKQAAWSILPGAHRR